ncbi:MAG TPA: NmrA family NAD(P)-binding protein [Bacteroidales bacterium]|nr:NmrA family NAD(P)-binding protein [Bacteroidales bacterium]
MKNILITGATGNAGALITEELRNEKDIRLFAGVRDVERAGEILNGPASQDLRYLDFEDTRTYSSALEGIDTIFLLRPPQLAAVNKYFLPFLEQAREKNIGEIVFLSVQGVEKSRIIPHHKIEDMVISLGFDFVFIRPAYFMQNLTTIMLNDIVENNRIYLPARDGVFNWIDVEDIARASAIVLRDFKNHRNSVYTLTGGENLNFRQVADMLTEQLGREITYISPTLLNFFLQKRREGLPSSQIFVMILLHYLPAFERAPDITGDVERLTGKKPSSLAAFIEREKNLLQ